MNKQIQKLIDELIEDQTLFVNLGDNISFTLDNEDAPRVLALDELLVWNWGVCRIDEIKYVSIQEKDLDE